MSKNGFTLIELLVVVLIIGILAAIALPQYEKSVLKSRAATVQSLIASLASANERYYLTNGAYTNNLNNLDITMPSYDTSYVSYCGVTVDGSYCNFKYGEGSLIAHYYDNISRPVKGKVVCSALTSSKAHDACRLLTGKNAPDQDNYYYF